MTGSRVGARDDSPSLKLPPSSATPGYGEQVGLQAGRVAMDTDYQRKLPTFHDKRDTSRFELSSHSKNKYTSSKIYLLLSVI